MSPLPILIALVAAVIGYGLLQDVKHWLERRARRRFLLAELRVRYEAPGDPLDAIWNLPARTPDHEAIP